jgi:hypothetical protein
MPNRILLKFTGRRDEVRAAGAISPGHICKRNSDGEAVVHATAGGHGEFLLALENALIGDTVDDAYADNDLVFVAIPLPGDLVQCILADSQTITREEALTSNGDGTLKVVGAVTDVVVGYAEEDVTTSGAVAFIKTRWASSGGQ